MMKSALLYLLATSACALATPALAKAGAQDCAGLGAFPVMGGHVTQTHFSAAEPALAGNGKADHPARPENCVVSGTINPRQGIDGRTYGIRFELRLPTLWRGRFYYGGGGGVDGFLPAADGTYPSGDGQHSALGDGMAVVVTDSGHEIDATRANGAFLFGADPQARDEYGDQQLPLVADAAKRLIAAYYGSPARYSYFYGCSNGGRQAMVAAQRLPDLFDGIIACSPGFRLAEASILGGIIRPQLAATIAPRKADGSPDLGHPLDAATMARIRTAILADCDDLDGARDGIVGHPAQCRFDPANWACSRPDGKRRNDAVNARTCLDDRVVRYVSSFLDGGRLKDGTRIYTSVPADPAGVEYMGAEPEAYFALFAGEASHVYTTPPTITPDLLGYALHADPATEYRKLSAQDATFRRSGMALTNATSPDMDAFQRHGGKILFYNGTADWAFPTPDLEAYYARVGQRYGAEKAASFTRLYIVPGMLHGHSREAADQFDAMGALVDWVEQGKAPGTLAASTRRESVWPGRARPLCVYPAQVTYTGAGSIEKASSFTCR